MDATTPASDGELLKVLTRLMTPFRREFHQSLDVNRLLVDHAYAQDVLNTLQQSDHPSIVSARLFLHQWMKIDVATASVATAELDAPSHAAVLTSAPVNANAPAEVPTPTVANQTAPDTKYVKRLR